MSDRDVLAPKDIESELGCSVRTVYRLIGTGFPYVEIGGRRVVRREAFLEALAAREVPASVRRVALPRRFSTGGRR